MSIQKPLVANELEILLCQDYFALVGSKVLVLEHKKG